MRTDENGVGAEREAASVPAPPSFQSRPGESEERVRLAAFVLPSPFEETVLAAWGFLVWRAARASRRAHRIRAVELPRLED